jgi:TPR repeat protein
MMLGRYLSRNLAGEFDMAQARKWLERAVAQGLQDAKADLAALPPAADPTPPDGVHQDFARASGP